MAIQVRETYANRSVFLTGATGFLGKVIIEKLLWSFDNMGKIYLLIRNQKGKGHRERLQSLLKDPLFDRIREHKPHALDKLVAVAGDMMEEQLGLNQHDMQCVCDEVSVVIHCAATVKFDEQLRVAVEMNVLGTTRIIALCHKIKTLISLVHVSTAYANCDLPETEEKIYKPPVPPQQLLEALKWMDDEMLSLITPKLLGNRPNTYTFTKALAETQMEEDARGLPVIMVRPSIVGAMWGAPLPGWTDNLNGPTGIFAAVGKGVLTNMCGSAMSRADIVPVDIVSNMIIVAAAYRAQHKLWRHDAEIPVMHCASGDLNPLCWDTIVQFLEIFYNEYPMNECAGVPVTYFHRSRKLFLLNYYIRHHIPAKTMDFFNGIMGKKQMNVRLYGKVWRMIEILHFFTTRGWLFHSKGMTELLDQMQVDEKEDFNFDIRQVNWESYLFDYVMGIKRYLVKDKLEDLEAAKQNLRKLRMRRSILTSIGWFAAIHLMFPQWRNQKKLTAWVATMVGTHFFLEGNYRSGIKLKSLEEYNQTAIYVPVKN